MSTLYVYNDKSAAQADVVTQDLTEIARILAAKGVRFEPFALQRLVIHGPGGEARLAGCKECLTPGAPPPHS